MIAIINYLLTYLQLGIKLFADNTSHSITIGDIQAIWQLNNDLQIVNECTKKWLVSFNSQKTKSLCVTLKHTIYLLPLLFDGQELENMASHKHLGLVLNNTLTWRDHIEVHVQTRNEYSCTF